MSLTHFMMLSDQVDLDASRDGDMGGLSALIYFLTVCLWIPSSQAIPRMDRPFRFAFCTAFHLAVCKGVGFLRRRLVALRTLPVPLRLEVWRDFSASWIVSGLASVAVHFLPRPLVDRLGMGVCMVLPAKPRRTLGRGGAS